MSQIKGQLHEYLSDFLSIYTFLVFAFESTLQYYAAILFIGVFCGSLFFGYLSDRYGRKLALLVAITTVTISPTIGAYMPTAAGFGFFRFLMGKS